MDGDDDMHENEYGSIGDLGSGGAAASKQSRQRKIKTPLQKEVLEASYLINPFPSEEHRRALGERIGLTEGQVQVWFTNRRRKDKKQDKVIEPGHLSPGGGDDHPSAAPLAKLPSGTSVTAVKPAAKKLNNTTISGPGKKHAALVQLGSTPASRQPAAAQPRSALPSPHFISPPAARSFSPTSEPEANDFRTMLQVRTPHSRLTTLEKPPLQQRNFSTPPALLATPATSIVAACTGEDDSDEETEEEEDIAVLKQWQEYRELLEVAKRTLSVPFREDGPPLAFEFDEIGSSGPKRPRGQGVGAKRKRIVTGDVVAEVDEEGITGIRKRRPGTAGASRKGGTLNAMDYENELEVRRQYDVEKVERKRQDEADRRLRKEAEKAAQLQRKLENTMKKEQDRLRKELVKQQERLEKEKRREEEERLKEQERLERERKKRLEKMEKERMKEELRKQKELDRMRQAHERELRKIEVKREREKKTSSSQTASRGAQKGERDAARSGPARKGHHPHASA